MEKLDISGLSSEIKAKIIGLCKVIVPDAAIWIYGSRARGDYKKSSDIDIALQAPQLISLFVIAELKDVLNAASLPHFISWTL